MNYKFVILCCLFGFAVDGAMSVPTVTLDEVARGIQSETTKPIARKVLEGILNDYMALLYGLETDYTTGKRVLPSETTIEEVDAAAADPDTEGLYVPVFKTISNVYNSGDLTPRDPGYINWDPKLKPVLVVVRPNPTN